MRALNKKDSRVSSYKPGNAGLYSWARKKSRKGATMHESIVLFVASSADAFQKGEHVLKVERLIRVFKQLMKCTQIYAEVFLGAAGSSGQHLRGEQRNNLHKRVDTGAELDSR